MKLNMKLNIKFDYIVFGILILTIIVSIYLIVMNNYDTFASIKKHHKHHKTTAVKSEIKPEIKQEVKQAIKQEIKSCLGEQLALIEEVNSQIELDK